MKDNPADVGQAKNLLSGTQGPTENPARGNITGQRQAVDFSGDNITGEGQIEDVAVTNPSNDDFNFQQLLHSFQTIYERMTQKILISVGRYLETEIYSSVMKQVAGGFKEMNQVFLWVIDLNDPLIKCWLGDELLQEIRDRVLPLPKVHPSVIKSISGFVRVSQSYYVLLVQVLTLPQFTTADQYRDHSESTAYRSGELYNREKHFGAAWVHSAMRHLWVLFLPLLVRKLTTGCRISLIHDSENLLLSDELLEGSLECVLWANLVDLLIVDVLVARRYII